MRRKRMRRDIIPNNTSNKAAYYEITHHKGAHSVSDDANIPPSVPSNAELISTRLKQATVLMMPGRSSESKTKDRMRIEVSASNPVWIGVGIGDETSDYNAMDGGSALVALNKGSSFQVDLVTMWSDKEYTDWDKAPGSSLALNAAHGYDSAKAVSYFEFDVPFCSWPDCTGQFFQRNKAQLLLIAYGDQRSCGADCVAANEHRVSSRTLVSISWDTGDVQKQSSGWKRPAHGIVMIIAFAVIMPIGSIFPMFCRHTMKKWYFYHRTFQLIAIGRHWLRSRILC